MIRLELQSGDPMASAEELERLTGLLDEVLTLMANLIGPIGMQARVAGRVLRVQIDHRRAPE
jgi:hypothetical protein